MTLPATSKAGPGVGATKFAVAVGVPSNAGGDASPAGSHRPSNANSRSGMARKHLRRREILVVPVPMGRLQQQMSLTQIAKDDIRSRRRPVPNNLEEM